MDPSTNTKLRFLSRDYGVHVYFVVMKIDTEVNDSRLEL